MGKKGFYEFKDLVEYKIALTYKDIAFKQQANGSWSTKLLTTTKFANFAEF
jgi:hypothetical protein